MRMSLKYGMHGHRAVNLQSERHILPLHNNACFSREAGSAVKELSSKGGLIEVPFFFQGPLHCKINL